jgi:hypothetical protein
MTNTATASLTLGICYSRGGSANARYVILVDVIQEANVLRRTEQRLCEPENATRTAYLNRGRSWTLQTPSNEDAIIAVVEREPWRTSRDIAREFGLSQTGVLGSIP